MLVACSTVSEWRAEWIYRSENLTVGPPRGFHGEAELPITIGPGDPVPSLASKGGYIHTHVALHSTYKYTIILFKSACEI